MSIPDTRRLHRRLHRPFPVLPRLLSRPFLGPSLASMLAVRGLPGLTMASDGPGRPDASFSARCLPPGTAWSGRVWHSDGSPKRETARSPASCRSLRSRIPVVAGRFTTGRRVAGRASRPTAGNPPGRLSTAAGTVGFRVSLSSLRSGVYLLSPGRFSPRSGLP